MSSTRSNPDSASRSAAVAGDSGAVDRRVMGITRPDRALLMYYLLIAFVVPPAAIVLLPLLYARYRTMRYVFSEDSVSMRWGLLFRREVIVNYARIQDINLQSNILERALGLARIHLQTASAGAQAELTIEGIRDFELVRDFLYRRLQRRKAVARGAAPAGARGGATDPTVTALLHEVSRELRAARVALADRRGLDHGDFRHV